MSDGQPWPNLSKCQRHPHIGKPTGPNGLNVGRPRMLEQVSTYSWAKVFSSCSSREQGHDFHLLSKLIQPTDLLSETGSLA
jgi:hypothetical protein